MCKKKQFKYCPSEIDKCMRNAISVLKASGIKTKGSCCGHGKHPMTIIYGEKGGNFELFSGLQIPRTRNFYKKDEEGYYYIPEIVDKKEKPKVCEYCGADKPLTRHKSVSYYNTFMWVCSLKCATEFDTV